MRAVASSEAAGVTAHADSSQAEAHKVMTSVRQFIGRYYAHPHSQAAVALDDRPLGDRDSPGHINTSPEVVLPQ